LEHVSANLNPIRSLFIQVFLLNIQRFLFQGFFVYFLGYSLIKLPEVDIEREEVCDLGIVNDAVLLKVPIEVLDRNGYLEDHVEGFDAFLVGREQNKLITLACVGLVQWLNSRQEDCSYTTHYKD
jgi:hypothetical protein